LTRWSPRNRRARTLGAAAAWFNPERWSQYDLVIAVSVLVLVVSSFMPWYKATVKGRFAHPWGVPLSRGRGGLAR